MTTDPKHERGGPKPSDPPVREGLGSPAWQTVDAWIRSAEELGCAEFAVQNVSDLHRLRDDIANITPYTLPVSREAALILAPHLPQANCPDTVCIPITMTAGDLRRVFAALTGETSRPAPKPCAICDGTGRRTGPPRDCGACNGSGRQ